MVAIPLQIKCLTRQSQFAHTAKWASADVWTSAEASDIGALVALLLAVAPKEKRTSNQHGNTCIANRRVGVA